ncbi:branched-chain amino acid ABC transporter substrate-binding protein [Telmatospirillum sp.]|uniref:branched-chain amino acid ABC transporter substrate-binding protein n=1 Tax=Telmatospirillum sp. TaxID=2079197 RepID=UPI0028513F45|nr:branched-chain amino acid ABC transporter substrate-binding protein [Telmatospirillum sp.]MDR3441250.1 branched-chain amino acid ABC transporter substrate-binding protein [Telmatospirillum sp.]
MRTKIPVLLAAMAISLIGSVAKADIAIGVAGPMTGSEAQFGEQFRHGATKAVEDINAKGGVLGQKLQLITGDDACDPKQAVSVANDFVAKKAVFVVGHFCSSSSIPASDVYAEANVVQISPGSTNPSFTERGLANTFRVCGRDDAQGPTAAKYIVQHFKGKNIAIAHDKSTYGKGLADQFQTALNGLGVKEVLYEAVTAGEKDYSPLVSKLKDVKADVLYFGGYKTEGGLIVRQIRDQGLKATLVGGDALVTEEFWAITGAAGEGTLMTFGPDPRLNPANAGLVKYFRDQNYEPEAYTLYTYAAIQAWAQAAEKAGSVDGTKVETALRANQFDTVLGKIGFDAKGDVTAPGYVFYIWNDGKYVYAQ